MKFYVKSISPELLNYMLTGREVAYINFLINRLEKGNYMCLCNWLTENQMKHITNLISYYFKTNAYPFWVDNNIRLNEWNKHGYLFTIASIRIVILQTILELHSPKKPKK